jgi:hypothetical protein
MRNPVINAIVLYNERYQDELVIASQSSYILLTCHETGKNKKIIL